MSFGNEFCCNALYETVTSIPLLLMKNPLSLLSRSQNAAKAISQQFRFFDCFRPKKRIPRAAGTEKLDSGIKGLVSSNRRST